MPLRARLLSPQAPDWSSAMDALRRQLAPAHGPHLLPPHFLKVILPKIGGHVALFAQEEQPERTSGVGFLFPRGLDRAGRIYTLRFHALETPPPSPAALTAALQALLPGRFHFYDPAAPHTFTPSSQPQDGVDIGRPSQAEALAIQALYQRIWGSPPEQRYPADIHSQEFGLGASLVARVDGRVAGFLFGFLRFDGSPLPGDWEERFRGELRLESQVMGVDPAFRGRGIGFLLKRTQARDALRQGIRVVHWTADPLQFPNAALNFARLGAVAFDFYPNHYPIHNQLNRAPASRFELTWLVQTRRAAQALAHPGPAPRLDLSRRPDVVRVNRGWRDLLLDAEAPTIAVEIPARWTQLQAEDPQEALAWRQATDRLFLHYLGPEIGRYMVTGVGVAGERRFVVAQRVDPALLARIGAPLDPVAG